MKYSDVDFNGKSIFITGGAGFIGSNLAFYFQNNFPDAKVVVFDRFRSGETFGNGNLKSFGHFKNLLGFSGTVISGDINSKEDIVSLEESFDFDYIFHEAAVSDTTVTDQEIMIKTNVNAFKDLLDMALKMNANMVYASSAATYGNAPSPQKVGSESPENVYGFSKMMMDNVAYEYMKKEGIKNSIVGLRYFNVYGPREFYKNKTASMVVQLGHQILNKKPPRLFEGSDKILRDFVYIEDIVQANIKAASAKTNGVYNVGSGIARSFQDIADILQRELDLDMGTEYFENPYGDAYQTYTLADIESTRNFLGYDPRFSLEDGIKSYMKEIKRLFEQEVLDG